MPHQDAFRSPLSSCVSSAPSALQAEPPCAPAKASDVAEERADGPDREGKVCLMAAHDRPVHYLRLSVTDRCNLRCRYCRVDHTFIPHDAVLRYEEMEALVSLLVSMGVSKVRLTGGEPFVRKGFPDFLRRLRGAHPEVDLRLTTNGVLLAPHAALLRELGVKVNLSLDTLRPERFAHITGRDLLARVRESLTALLAAGVPVKLNAVALRGFNDDELPDFLKLAQAHPLDVRFIEFMPMGEGTLWNTGHYWSADDILTAAHRCVSLTPAPRNAETDGPARMYTMAGAKGRFGLITPLSNHFCAACNRLRITSDGRLRTCLFDDHEYRLAPVLRHPGLGVGALGPVIREALNRKPIGAHLMEKRGEQAVARRAMTAIGG